uniref:Uncharacterized protein n=1 Tax=Ditylenchus dipsaci TaxID=166011 RepID=A0A915CL08_9BILA
MADHQHAYLPLHEFVTELNTRLNDTHPECDVCIEAAISNTPSSMRFMWPVHVGDPLCDLRSMDFCVRARGCLL